MPAAWVYAVGSVAAGYLLRMAALVDDGDVQVSIHKRSVVPKFSVCPVIVQPVQRPTQTFDL